MFFYRQDSPPGSASDDRCPSDHSIPVMPEYFSKILDHLLLVAADTRYRQKIFPGPSQNPRCSPSCPLANVLESRIRYVSAFIVTCHLEGTPGPALTSCQTEERYFFPPSISPLDTGSSSSPSGHEPDPACSGSPPVKSISVKKLLPFKFTAIMYFSFSFYRFLFICFHFPGFCP